MEVIKLETDDNEELYGIICTRKEMLLLNAFNYCCSSSVWNVNSDIDIKSEYYKELDLFYKAFYNVGFGYNDRPLLRLNDTGINTATIEVIQQNEV